MEKLLDLLTMYFYFLFKDYDDFDIANEDDTLEEFLGLPKKDPPVDPNAPPKEGEPGKPDQPAVNGEEPMSVDKA